MKDKRGSSLFWLLLIPCQLAADVFLVYIGSRIDLMLFSDSEAHGHGIPVFSAIFFLIAVFMTLIVLIMALVMAIRGLHRRQK